jgi:hypothetical protein
MDGDLHRGLQEPVLHFSAARAGPLATEATGLVRLGGHKTVADTALNWANVRVLRLFAHIGHDRAARLVLPLRVRQRLSLTVWTTLIKAQRHPQDYARVDGVSP